MQENSPVRKKIPTLLVKKTRKGSEDRKTFIYSFINLNIFFKINVKTHKTKNKKQSIIKNE
jgi:hypothetical protein